MSLPTELHLRSKESTAYDASRFASVLNWTKASLLLHGNPVSIVSAEFQYFRVPDRTRWRPLLTDIKGMGFNALRLYIHWGYHSPAEGVYNFRGNRDIVYLLNLCVELQLFVIAAPGPYICAEVQAGGYPIWLIAKRNLRVRHMALQPVGLFKKWDEQWHQHCAAYMRIILKMLIPFERTTNPKGCIIALQIENELREMKFVNFCANDAEIRRLCELARKEGSTVPFFHNDDAPIGSWATGGDIRSLKKVGAKTGQKAYRTDLYGFDLYFTFPPGDRSGDLSSCQLGMLEILGISSCLNCLGIGGTGVGGSDTPCLSCLYENRNKYAPPPPLAWAEAGQMESAVDSLENKLERIGGSARHGPVIVAETQVGWINQWGRMRTYDDIYTFFGEHFSATLLFSLMSQGITYTSHYAAYGGTNHGTVGDTEVYSSYDYSAFIREYGLLSGRGRRMRMANLFVRSFSDLGLSTSLPVESPSHRSKALAHVKATVPDALLKVRFVPSEHEQTTSYAGEAHNRRAFAFLRNLKHSMLRFNLIVNNLVLPVRLKKCESMVAPLYHKLSRSLSIFACTVPVLCRAMYEGSELWVLRVRPEEVGRIVLNVIERMDTSRYSLAIKRAAMPQSVNATESIVAQELLVTDQDPGAATSILDAPLEELPLAEQNSLAKDGNPLGVKASTEEIGLCFSFSFAMAESNIVRICDMSESGSSNPVLRLLCLCEADAQTFTADLNGNDYYNNGSSTPFAAAWGASNLTFTPSGQLDVGMCSQDENSAIFMIRENSTTVSESFRPASSELGDLLPGISMHESVAKSLFTALSQGWKGANPLSRNFEIKVDGWSKRSVSWADDVMWKRIAYENRDPLDHFMTSGHIAYRLRFRSSSKRGALILNVRHSAVVWCNGIAVGDQVCFSHNLLSAGAMHAIDVYYAGKKRHDLSAAMRNGPDQSGFHDIVIFVLSMGQSRSPFLLNDIRNRRGLISARLSHATRVSDVNWEMAGVDVTRTDDAYCASGLPLEDEANSFSYDVGFAPTPGLEVKANAGLVYYRATFKVPAASVVGGTVRFPLRVQILTGALVRAMLWVNNLFVGRYVEPLGPQKNFYIPEGLITEYKGNSIVIGVYGPVDTNISVKILPWVVNMDSGNLDERNGDVYALKVASFALVENKLTT